MKRYLFSIFVFLLMPAISFAQTNTSLVVPCNGTATTTSTILVHGVNQSVPPCDFNTLVATVSHIIQWLFYISVPIMVALFAYSGLLYMTGVQKHIDKAKGVFKNVALGFTIMLVAFVVINTLVGWVGNSGFTTGQDSQPSNPAVLLNQSQ
jgi:hypothetical protein